MQNKHNLLENIRNKNFKTKPINSYLLRDLVGLRTMKGHKLKSIMDVRDAKGVST